ECVVDQTHLQLFLSLSPPVREAIAQRVGSTVQEVEAEVEASAWLMVGARD
ncbi:hypothetical protein KIPB_010080, partial [Kipferlia bialata]